MLAPENSLLQEKTTFDVDLEMWVSVDVQEAGGGARKSGSS